MKIDLLVPYEKNAKKHPRKQIEQVAASIKEFGFNQPIVVDKDNVVIVGHGRLEAAKLLGLEDVPVETVDLTKEQAAAYRLADNKLNESEWEMDLVIEELKELSEPMFDLTGFDKDLLLGENAFGEEFSLADGDKPPFQQMTFTLADKQAEYIKKKIADIKQTEEYRCTDCFGNENSNGNAIYCLLTL